MALNFRASFVRRTLWRYSYYRINNNLPWHVPKSMRPGSESFVCHLDVITISCQVAATWWRWKKAMLGTMAGDLGEKPREFRLKNAPRGKRQISSPKSEPHNQVKLLITGRAALIEGETPKLRVWGLRFFKDPFREWVSWWVSEWETINCKLLSPAETLRRMSINPPRARILLLTMAKVLPSQDEGRVT